LTDRFNAVRAADSGQKRVDGVFTAHLKATCPEKRKPRAIVNRLVGLTLGAQNFDGNFLKALSAQLAVKSL